MKTSIKNVVKDIQTGREVKNHETISDARHDVWILRGIFVEKEDLPEPARMVVVSKDFGDKLRVFPPEHFGLIIEDEKPEAELTEEEKLIKRIENAEEGPE